MTGRGKRGGDGRAEASSATGDGGQAATSLTADTDGMHVCIFEGLQLEGSCVGGLLYFFLSFCFILLLCFWTEKQFPVQITGTAVCCSNTNALISTH